MELVPDTSHAARPTLAVVVPATDRTTATLSRCIAALRSGTRHPDELILQRRPLRCGPAAARNVGAARSEADVLVFVDADVEVHPDALDRIGRRFAAEPELTALFGAYDTAPAAPGLTSRFRNLLHHHVHAEAAGEAETFWAGLGAVRRGEFERAGGFDARRFPRPSIEDIDLGRRLRGAGGRIVLDPAILGRHLKAWTPASMVWTDFARRGVPWARLLLRDRGANDVLNLGWRQRLGAATSLAALIALFARRPRLLLAALLAGAVLNRRFYGLLASRGGPRLLAAGFGLHQVHHLTAAAAPPAALVLHLLDRRER